MIMNIYIVLIFLIVRKKNKFFLDKDFFLLLYGFVLYNIVNNYIFYCLKLEV